MSIYKELLEAVSNGSRFKIDLVNKSLTIDRKKIIEKGVVKDEAKTLIEKWDLALEVIGVSLDEEPWVWIERLYGEYKRSVPREHSNGNKSYFKAVDSSELSLREMSINDDRDYAQCRLEAYILLASLQGWLKFNFNGWFWQSKLDKELVVLKQFIERKQYG